MLKLRTKKGVSTVEYVMMTVAVLAAILIMRAFFIRGLGGRWKQAGDSIGFGRLYQPGVTKDCGYLFDSGQGQGWFDQDQFDQCFADPTNGPCKDKSQVTEDFRRCCATKANDPSCNKNF